MMCSLLSCGIKGYPPAADALADVYNALTIHAFVAMPSLPSSPMEVKDFWKV